jgi:hypothetical protein
MDKEVSEGEGAQRRVTRSQIVWQGVIDRRTGVIRVRTAYRGEADGQVETFETEARGTCRPKNQLF